MKVKGLSPPPFSHLEQVSLEAWPESWSEAKVANLDGHVLVYEHVAQLQVSVQHLLKMHVSKQGQLQYQLAHQQHFK